MALPIVYRSPENPNVVAAKTKLKQEREKAQARRAARANAPVPNRICYAETAFKNWKPGDKVPPCKKCGGLLHPGENHKCDGFQAKFVEHTPERKERWKAKREEIRESRLEEMRESRNSHYCDHCGEELLNEEHAIEHAEDCRRAVECPDCGEELEFMVEHECSVRECRRCGESLCWGTEHSCEP